MKKFTSLSAIITLIFLMLTCNAFPQKHSRMIKHNETDNPDTALYSQLKYRLVGPFRGGRCAAVTGLNGNKSIYYMGTTGGGIWKTYDAGREWKNISDGYFGGTIGAVDVAGTDNNVIYVAGGEKTVRGNVSHGYGIWKSVDAGETWNYKGLAEGQYITRIRVHPQNSNIVYAAVLGHIFGPNDERGIYRSKNGGDTWEKVLFVDENTGAVDLILDPTNPRIIYASTWQVRRTPYSLISGGKGSAIWKSSDSGDTWTCISANKGMPEGPLGISGIALSAADPTRVYAMIEAHEGGLFVSNDRGKSWRRVNSERMLRQRAWYYTRIYSDPADADVIYVLNVGCHKSVDGGKTFTRIRTPHGDHHDLWIDPFESNNLIIGDDGGAQVSHDGGKTWSTLMNQPTGQFYRLTTDNHFPYRIYSGQQDNSTIRLESRSLNSAYITENNWESTAGGESAWIAPDPDDPEIVFGGSYGGYLQRLNHRTGESRRIDIWPDNPMGWGADSLKERFQWNYPILFSRHDNDVLYAASNRLFRTTNEGQTWETISPDLTRDDKTRMGPSGGPITKDNTSVEYYGTIFAITESYSEKGVIWCGSDDGMIHISKNNGESWEDVTPNDKLVPHWAMINSIEPDPFNPGGLFVAATAYKSDDFTPYLLYSSDYGHSWTRITNGINEKHFTRVIRADNKRKGLLFCGTESGMYVSFDNGASWKPFQLNLPVVPVTDIVIKDNDLVIATQGRAIWIFDHLNILREADNRILNQACYLFKPEDAYRVRGRSNSRPSSSSGTNPAKGILVNFYLNDIANGDTITLDIIDKDGFLAHSFVNLLPANETGSHTPYEEFEPRKGLNQLTWDLSYPGAKKIKDMVLWGGYLEGPIAVPGIYKVRLKKGKTVIEKELELKANPLSEASGDDLQLQFDYINIVNNKLTETHNIIEDIRFLKKELVNLQKRVNGRASDEITDNIIKVRAELSDIENELYQTKNRSPQDPLNYPIKLGNKLAALNGVVATGEYRPTDQAEEVKEMLIARINAQIQKYKIILDVDIKELEKLLDENDIPYLSKGF